MFIDATYIMAAADSRAPVGDVTSADERTMTEMLQASYMCCVYQHWEGDHPARKRLRRRRFSVVVGVCSSSHTRNMWILQSV